MNGVLRVGVVGGGLIAQAVHLPNLAAMRDRFEVVAIADPSSRPASTTAACVERGEQITSASSRSRSSSVRQSAWGRAGA